MIFETKPFEHQITAYNKAMEWLKDHSYFALFMDMGTGKTKTSIDIASNLFKDGKIEAVLLIAPNGVQEQWYSQEIFKHTPVITTELLWKNSKAQYWLDKLYEFVGPEKESIEFLKEQIEQEKQFEQKTTEEEKAHKEDIDKINALFEDLSSNEESTTYIYSKPIIDRPLRESKWENQKDCLKWLCVNVDRFSSGDQRTFQPFIDYLTNHKTLMIIDEATIVKNPNANRTKIIKKLGKMAKYRIILTGTPVTNSPFDVWSMLDVCKDNFWNCNYFLFKNRYGIVVRDSVEISEGVSRSFKRDIRPDEIKSVLKYLNNGQNYESVSAIMGISESNVKWIQEHPETKRPYKRLGELKTIIQPCSFTIKKEDCLDIPPKIFETVLLEMDKEQSRVYKELKSKMLAMYAGQELTVQNKVSLGMRLQQIAGGFFPYKDEDLNSNIKAIGKSNPKIDKLVQDIGEAGDLRIIIWSRFVPEIELIIGRLKKAFPNRRVEGYYGGTPSIERNQIKNDFQEGTVDVLVINPQTGSRGLNLQKSTLHYFYSNHYSLEYRNQAEDRSHRYGQTLSVQYKDLVMKGTIDEKILIALRQHREVLDFFRSKNLEELI